MSKAKRTEIKIDRRKVDRRKKDRRTAEPAANTVVVERRKSERRKVQRRRQIDPTTCERDYTNDEIEFMQAMDAYKRQSGSNFPTCAEILQVLLDLGYHRSDQAYDGSPKPS